MNKTLDFLGPSVISKFKSSEYTLLAYSRWSHPVQSEWRKTVKMLCLHVVPKTAFYYRRYWKHLVKVLLIHYSHLCSLMFAGKKILPLLCISLEICLYKPRCLAVYLQLPAVNCVTARWEKSSALFSSSTKISVSWEHSRLAGLSPHHRCLQTCKNAGLYLSFYSSEVVSWEMGL